MDSTQNQMFEDEKYEALNGLEVTPEEEPIEVQLPAEAA